MTDDRNNAAERMLSNLECKGVTLWMSDSQLRYRAPKAALTLSDIERLRQYRKPIIAILEARAANDGYRIAASPPDGIRRWPLAYSQIAHWKLHELAEQRSTSVLKAVIAIYGAISVSAWQSSVDAIVRRHDALRTRIAMSKGAPLQEIRSAPPHLTIEDWRSIPPSLREIKVHKMISESPAIDLKTDPLFAARLALLDKTSAILEINMDHIISDGSSMSICMDELCTSYKQAIAREQINLPTVAVQFGDYALRQRMSERAWVTRNACVLRDRFVHCERIRFPDTVEPSNRTTGLGLLHFEIPSALRCSLVQWSKSNGTTLVMAAFTAYVASVMRWCNSSAAVVPFYIDGRSFDRLDNTIGYLAFPLYVRARLQQGDTFLSLLARLTAEYCEAYEHADFCYMEAQSPRPEFTRNSSFNWIPFRQNARLDMSSPPACSVEFQRLIIEQERIEHARVDTEPALTVSETEDKTKGCMSFSSCRFSRSSIEQFTANYLRNLHAMVYTPSAEIMKLHVG